MEQPMTAGGVVSEKQCSNPVSHSRPAAADRSAATGGGRR
ncbi:Uncharacterised protein [Amycolatopsis camponoti]|uniref:Uncharacterized protein n=1 Tax=Amycolatopsis camponoti TaxID=2606593 RepID=A0A6I8LK76_9PSEU|nr:Uncharacterised protein [Amycolatopsis camponoti]